MVMKSDGDTRNCPKFDDTHELLPYSVAYILMLQSHTVTRYRVVEDEKVAR